MTPHTILVTGYAPAPKGTSMYERYKYMGAVLEIDVTKNVIVDAEFTFVTQLANNFASRLVRGYDLSQGIEPLCSLVTEHYVAPSAQAFVMALRVAYQRYGEQMKRNGKKI